MCARVYLRACVSMRACTCVRACVRVTRPVQNVEHLTQDRSTWRDIYRASPLQIATFVTQIWNATGHCDINIENDFVHEMDTFSKSLHDKCVCLATSSQFLSAHKSMYSREQPGLNTSLVTHPLSGEATRTNRTSYWNALTIKLLPEKVYIT